MHSHSSTLPVSHLSSSRPVRRLRASLLTGLAGDNVHRAFRTGGFALAAACVLLLIILTYRQASLPSSRKGPAAGSLTTSPGIMLSQTTPGGVLLAASAGSSQALYALSSSGLFYSADAGGQLSLRAATPELPAAITTLAVDPRDPATLLIASETAGVFKSTDGGRTFLPSSLGMSLDASSSIAAIHLSSGLPRMALAAAARWSGASRATLVSQDLYLSNNDGSDWFRVAGLDLTAPASAIYLDPATLNVQAWAAGQAARPVALDQTLIAVLQTGTPLEQDQAITALGLLGARSAEPYLHARFWMEAQPHPSTAMALANLGTPTALNALVQALANPQMTPRRQSAMAALESLGSRSTPALLAALESEDATLRANAANLLGWIADPQAVPALRSATNDPDPAVRQEAAWAMTQIGSGSRFTGKLAWLDEALTGLLAWQGRLALAVTGLVVLAGALLWTRGRPRVGRGA
jgi:hypothetical protein